MAISYKRQAGLGSWWREKNIAGPFEKLLERLASRSFTLTFRLLNYCSADPIERESKALWAVIVSGLNYTFETVALDNATPWRNTDGDGNAGTFYPKLTLIDATSSSDRHGCRRPPFLRDMDVILCQAL